MVMRYAPAKMPTRPPIRMAEASSAARLDIRISGYATQHSQAQHRSGPTPVGTKAGLEQGWPRTRLANAKACKGQSLQRPKLAKAKSLKRLGSQLAANPERIGLLSGSRPAVSNGRIGLK